MPSLQISQLVTTYNWETNKTMGLEAALIILTCLSWSENNKTKHEKNLQDSLYQ